MSRFVDVDLARLPRPSVIADLDYEILLADRMAEVTLRLQAAGIPYNVGALESDPVKKLVEHATYYELLLRARINDAARAVLLPSSWGTNLDSLAADLGVERMIVTPATANATAVKEDDESLRRRRQLAVEALTVAGPEGAYLFHALSALRLTAAGEMVSAAKDAAVYGPMSVRETAPGVFTAIGLDPGHVHIPILGRANADGAATAVEVAAVDAAVNAREVRPLADYVTVSAAAITTYAVAATLRIGGGADPGMVKALAEERLTKFVARQHRVGASVERQALAGVASVAGTDGLPVVDKVVLAQPGADIDPGAYGAPWCSSITVTVEIVDA